MSTNGPDTRTPETVQATLYASLIVPPGHAIEIISAAPVTIRGRRLTDAEVAAASIQASH